MNKIREGYKVTELGEIPNEWRISALGNICEFKGRIGWRGYTKNDLREYGPLVIGATQISASNKLDFSNPTYLSTEKYEESPEIKVYLNDIILVKTGNTIGKVAIVDKEIGDATINPNTVLLKNITCFNKYLYYIVVSEIIQKPLNKSITVGAQPSVNQETLKKILIPIPTLKEQEKIASILSTVDEQIDNVDALIEKNKELKKGLMQTLLTKGIGHTKFKKAEIGEIPEEWDVKKLECVFEILDSMRKPIKASDREKIEGNIPYYGASGVIDWINDYIFDEELILLGEDGENLNSRNSDLAFKIFGKTWVNNHAHVFRVINKKECNIDFMVYYLEAKDYSIYIAGSAQPKITQAQCRKFLLPLPEKQEQDKIASILLESDKKREEYENKKQKLEELKKGLMQQLLTGMIRVTV